MYIVIWRSMIILAGPFMIIHVGCVLIGIVIIARASRAMQLNRFAHYAGPGAWESCGSVSGYAIWKKKKDPCAFIRQRVSAGVVEGHASWCVRVCHYVLGVCAQSHTSVRSLAYPAVCWVVYAWIESHNGARLCRFASAPVRFRPSGSYVRP